MTEEEKKRLESLLLDSDEEGVEKEGKEKTHHKQVRTYTIPHCLAALQARLTVLCDCAVYCTMALSSCTGSSAVLLCFCML